MARAHSPIGHVARRRQVRFGLHHVPDEVGDHGRVARVVLGDAVLDLAHEVGADVRSFRVDPTAKLRRQYESHAPQQIARGCHCGTKQPVGQSEGACSRQQ
jgi:hypothetical protein